MAANKKIMVLSYPTDPHWQAVDQYLKKNNAESILLAGRELPQYASLSCNYIQNDIRITTPRNSFSLDEIHSIWNRRRFSPNCYFEPDRFKREYLYNENKVLYNALYDLTSEHYWLSSPHAIEHGQQKPFQLKVASALGFKIPKTYIGNSPKEAETFIQGFNQVAIKPLDEPGFLCSPRTWKEHWEGWKNCILEWLKPTSFDYPSDLFYSGFRDEFHPYRNLKIIYTNLISTKKLQKSLSFLQYCPFILQEYIEKSIELRITVVGNQLFAVAIHSQSSEGTKIDWRNQELQHVKHTLHTLPPWLEKQCFDLVRQLHLDFGCIDMILTPDGEYVFLEINPNGQWLWVEEAAHVPIAESIANLLISPQQYSLHPYPVNQTATLHDPTSPSFN